MAALDNILGNVVLLSGVDLEPYRFEINDNNVSFGITSDCFIDSDGDLILNFKVEEDDLLEIIDNSIIIAYLENNGYKVEEE